MRELLAQLASYASYCPRALWQNQWNKRHRHTWVAPEINKHTNTNSKKIVPEKWQKRGFGRQRNAWHNFSQPCLRRYGKTWRTYLCAWAHPRLKPCGWKKRAMYTITIISFWFCLIEYVFNLMLFYSEKRHFLSCCVILPLFNSFFHYKHPEYKKTGFNPCPPSNT